MLWTIAGVLQFINKEEPPPPASSGVTDADTAGATPRRTMRTEYSEEEFKKVRAQFPARVRHSRHALTSPGSMALPCHDRRRPAACATV